MTNHRNAFACLAWICFLIFPWAASQAQALQWATQVTANAESEGKVVFVDAQGNVYAAGLFRDTVDIDPGPGVVLVQTPGTATYVHKLDSNGHFIWGGSISTTDINVPRDIRVVPNGNVYLTGAVRGVADFDIGPAVHNLGTPYIWGGYTVCLDHAGNFLWAQVIENINLNTNDGAKVDSVGNVWIVGTIRDTVDFDPGPGVQVHIGTNSNEELVCAKYDPAGNFLFANLIGGPEYEASTSLNICPSGVYVLGYFEGTVDFDPGPGTVPLTALIYSPADRHSPFVLKYTHAGALDWVVRLDSLVPFGLSMAQEDNQGNLVMAFTFQARLDMNPGPGIDMTYSTMYNQAIAVIKLDPNGNYLWGMGLDGTGNEEFKTLGIDGDGGIYVIGNFETILDFDPGPGIAYLQTPTPGYYGGPGLLKLDPAGNFAWVTLLRDGGYVKPEHIVFDQRGDCYITGSFGGNSDLAPALLDTAILHGGNSTDPYIVKLRFDACNNYLLSIDSVADIHCATQMGWMNCSGNGTSASFAYSWNTNPPTLDSVALPTSPGIYTVTVNDSSGCQLQRSVLVNGPSAGNGFDMQANVVAGPFRTGGHSVIRLDAFNGGCTYQSGLAKLILEPHLTYLSANPAPDSISGDTLTWNLPATHYGDPHFTAEVSVATSNFVWGGDSIRLGTMILPIAGDSLPENNQRLDYLFPVINSLDPNQKSVYPAGACYQHYVLNQAPLTYTIQFQNTGNAEALEVVVLDTLSPFLDLNTLAVKSSSHAMYTEILPGNVLKFTFRDIHLPDSATNEPASHGYLTYEIKAAQGLNPEFEVHNGSAIYFDFNPPILTNVTLNTLVASIPTCTVGMQEPVALTGIALFPNPATQVVNLRSEKFLGEIRIVNTMGQLVYAESHAKQREVAIDVSRWAKGIYCVAAGTSAAKLIVE